VLAAEIGLDRVNDESPKGAAAAAAAAVAGLSMLRNITKTYCFKIPTDMH
jgi:hypothetical protein